MEKIVEHLKKIDWVLILVAVSLVCFGLISIYSASFFRDDFLNFKKQALFLVIGLLLMFATSFFDWRVLRDNPYLVLAFYFFTLISLALLFVFAPTIRAVKGWYRIGPFTIDPIEIVKISLIILLAKYFSGRHVEMYNIRHILISGLYVFAPFVLIFLQPNLGSAVILFLLWLGILIASGIEVKHFLLISLMVIILFAFSWQGLLEPYQRQRIVAFLIPNFEPLGIGWSQSQSKIAIGSGGLFGKGFRQGSQVQLGFLTLPQTDFIFSAIAEEFGLLGVVILFFLVLIFLSRIMRIFFESRTNFPRLFSLGFALLFITQIFVHSGMNLGLLPVIGIPFPFVSYGGSGLISGFVALGILQSLRIHRER